MKAASSLLIIFLFVSVNLVTIYASSEATVGFHTSSFTLQPYIRSFNLNITVFSGGSKIAAGEFNVSYPTEYVSLLRVDGCGNWTVTYVANRYVFYTLITPLDETIIASLHFNIKPSATNKIFNIKLDFFHAADKSGKDLDIAIYPEETKITVLEETAEEIEKPSVREWLWESSFVILAASIGIASIILITSFYVRGRGVKPHEYYLIDQQGRLIFRCNKPDRVYGREDFSSILEPKLLQYITRRSKGGQFRITRSGNQYYIIDQYSANPTIVDGIGIKSKGPVALKDGSVISISNLYKLVFKTKPRK